MKFKHLILAVFFLLTGIKTFSQSALKVVSLSPIASKALVLLGADDLVVGCTKWCPFAEDKQIVATAIDVNVEAVLRLSPDVVFTSTLTNKESIATLLQLGINVVDLPKMTTFDAICNELLIIGKEVGKTDIAKQEIIRAEKHLSTVRERIPAGSQPSIMFQIGAKPIFVAMDNTFMGDFIRQAGATNIYNDLDHGTVTRESVLLRNPEAIFISTMPTAAEDAKSAWGNYSQLSASVNNKVILVDQELASSPTVHTFVEVVEIMIDVLYN